MKQWIILVWIPIALMAGARTNDELNALSHGADVCMALKVVDDNGTIVSNATVMGNFHMHDDQGNPFTGSTDTNGIYAASGKCVGDWHYVVEKKGHYETVVNVRYFSPTNTSVKDGRWQPYGMTNTVVLKRKINPVAMNVWRGTSPVSLPKQNEWIGFDLERADWISPHGTGKREDFQVFFNLDAKDKQWSFFKYTLTLRFPKPFDGFYRMKKDEDGSAFKCAYRADTNHLYDSEITFISERWHDAAKNKAVSAKHPLEADDYLVLRVRSETDKEGRLVKANYAKLCAPFFAARYGFLIASYFNPNENDPNLEADTSKNLLNPRELSFEP